MLAKRGGVRHRRRVNLSNPSDRKNGRELMQIKVNDIAGNPLDRGEFKYAIEYPAEISTPDDRHPLLGIVKPSHRKDLKVQLASLGINAYAMRPILTVHDLRRRIYILRDKKTFISVSLDQARSEMMWAKFAVVEIEPELNEIIFTDADSATRAYMESINSKIVGALKARFPGLKRDLTPKYGKAFNSFESQVPFLRMLVKANLYTIESVAAGAILALAGVVGGCVIATRSFLANRRAVESA